MVDADRRRWRSCADGDGVADGDPGPRLRAGPARASATPTPPTATATTSSTRASTSPSRADRGRLRHPDRARRRHQAAAQLTRELTTLAARARAGELTPPELAGATFTLTDLGDSGVHRRRRAAQPAPGRRARRRRVRRGAGGPRRRGRCRGTRSRLTLACDGRILFGAHAAAFLVRIAELRRSDPAEPDQRAGGSTGAPAATKLRQPQRERRAGRRCDRAAASVRLARSRRRSPAPARRRRPIGSGRVGPPEAIKDPRERSAARRSPRPHLDHHRAEPVPPRPQLDRRVGLLYLTAFSSSASSAARSRSASTITRPDARRAEVPGPRRDL